MINTIMENLPHLTDLLAGIGVVVTAATAVTAVTPTQVDNRLQEKSVKAINIALRILNILAGNFGKNKNKDDAPP